jgi:hypothetical protein
VIDLRDTRLLKVSLLAVDRPLTVLLPADELAALEENPIKPRESYRQTPNCGEYPPTYSGVYADCCTPEDQPRLFERSRISVRQ